jgi:hypothetical protein
MGWLKKKDVKPTLGIWGYKRRWFTLQENRLVYYTEEQERFSFGKGTHFLTFGFFPFANVYIWILFRFWVRIAGLGFLHFRSGTGSVKVWVSVIGFTVYGGV